MKIKEFFEENVIKLAAGAIATYFIILLIVLVSGFLGQFTLLFTAFIMAIIIALTIKPLNDTFYASGMSRGMSVIFAYFIFFTILAMVVFLILPPLVDELRTLLGPGIAQIRENFPSLDPINSFLHQFNPNANISVDQLTKPLTDNVGNIISNLGLVATNIVGLLIEFILGIIFSIFLISDGKKFSQFIFKLTPKAFKDDYNILSNALIDGFRSFIKVQGLCALGYAFFVMLIAKILGYDYILIMGVLSFILFLIPGIGGPLALIPPLVIGLLFKSGDILNVIILMVVILVIQNVILNILIPKLYGERFGIHPALVLVVILVSLQLFGFLGVVVAIPVASAIQRLIANYFQNEKAEKNAKT